MYIEKVEIENFRIFGNKVEIFFQKGLNMLIGENNSGKTAIIDAIRLVMSLGAYKRNLYMDESDFHVNEYGIRSSEAKISIYFNDLNEDQKAELIYLSDVINPTSSKAEIHVNYTLYLNNKGEYRVKEEVLGYNEQTIPDKECLQKLTSIYMPALRNAEKDMQPSKYSQLSQLLLKFANTKEKKENLVKIISNMNNSIIKDITISEMQDSINKNLKSIEKEIINQKINISIAESSINDIGATLKLTNSKELKKICINKEEKDKIVSELITDIEDVGKYINEISEGMYILDIQEMKNDGIDIKENLKDKTEINFFIKQNGLGYNNILSMATELSNSKQIETDDFVLMLLEEPEAHLHPQLLYLLNDFLQENNNMQIILTSHSPTLISRFKIDKLIVLQQNEDKINISNLSKIKFGEGEQEIIERYLDVTKSQMFFAKGIIFVEGITEALLINEFSKILKRDLDKYAVEIVNINGVDFEPFAKIFQIENNENLLSTKCSIITDDDRCTNPDNKEFFIKKEEIEAYTKISEEDLMKINNKLNRGDMSDRAKKLVEYNKNNIKVVKAKKTFEYELAKIKENREIILKMLEEIHPQIHKLIEANKEEDSNELFATRIWIAIKDSKSEFAQKLLNKIIQGNSFVVPNYIKEAIEHVTEIIVEGDANNEID